MSEIVKVYPIIDRGGMSFKDADDANIPVDISLYEEEGTPGTWRLSASNYCPRKCQVYDGTYEVFCCDREKLVQMIKDYIIPLYQIGINVLNSMCQGKSDHLYYWDEKMSLTDKEKNASNEKEPSPE